MEEENLGFKMESHKREERRLMFIITNVEQENIIFGDRKELLERLIEINQIIRGGEKDEGDKGI